MKTTYHNQCHDCDNGQTPSHNAVKDNVSNCHSDDSSLIHTFFNNCNKALKDFNLKRSQATVKSASSGITRHHVLATVGNCMKLVGKVSWEAVKLAVNAAAYLLLGAYMCAHTVVTCT